MRSCTFHYWRMRRRKWFSFDVYKTRSQYFGYAQSLPSPEVMAWMPEADPRPSLEDVRHHAIEEMGYAVVPGLGMGSRRASQSS